MRITTRYSTISRVSGAVAGLWLCGAGAAWAGGGGADFGSLTALLTDSTHGLCTLFKISPCPTVPSITQAALEVAALGNNHPGMLLLQNQFVPSSRVQAINSPAEPALEYGASTTGPLPFPLTSGTVPPLFVAATPPTKTTPEIPASGLLANLKPLAFISQTLATGTAPATQLSDTNADTFLYAVSTGFQGRFAPLPKPSYVYFFYDDLSRFNLSFTSGTTIAEFTFPLRVNTVSTGVERAVPTTLYMNFASAADCSKSTVAGDFAGKGGGASQSMPAEQVGINCQVVLSASPASAQPHAIFEVAVPLLVTQASDPAYFYTFNNRASSPIPSNPVNSSQATQGVYTAFEADTPGQPLGNGTSIGLAPSAAPLCSDPSVSCTSNASASATFPLCANLPTKTTANSTQLRAAVGSFFALATSGETLLSAALGSESTSTCSLF